MRKKTSVLLAKHQSLCGLLYLIAAYHPKNASVLPFISVGRGVPRIPSIFNANRKEARTTLLLAKYKCQKNGCKTGLHAVERQQIICAAKVLAGIVMSSRLLVLQADLQN